jgi:glutamyl-tRNA reductase
MTTGTRPVTQPPPRVAQTVAALRGVAARIVEAELRRLSAKAPGLDKRSRAEVERSMHRIVDKLLHTPTVRVREPAFGPDGGSHAAKLRQLFALDPLETKGIPHSPVSASGGFASALGEASE